MTDFQVFGGESPIAASKSTESQYEQNRQNGKKSPILIKYNYYDHNGTKHEQTTQDMNHQEQQQSANETPKIQRQLSPTFKQSLDQIVRNSQQLQLSAARKSPNLQAHRDESPSSIPQLVRRYQMSLYEQRCLRCQKTVYQMDKVGPLKEFTFYHQNCFKCRECGTKLTLKTYFNNQQSSDDLEVYCHRHCPKTGPGKLDNQAVGIRAALNAPKVFDPLNSANLMLANGAPDASGWPLASSVFIRNGAPNGHANVRLTEAPNVDSKALHIQHAVLQTKLQNIYKQSHINKKLSQFINLRLEYLEPKQKLLEMRHREEEDALFKVFEQKWRQEETCITDQIRQEWQSELTKLLDKYKRQLSNISGTEQQAIGQSSSSKGKNKLNDSNENANINNSKDTEQKRMIEFERMNLENTMTIKLDRKRETLKRKLKEFERQATAELVEKQSREMLALISLKLDEFKEEQKRRIGSDLDQFEAIESLANQFDSSLRQLSGSGSSNNSDINSSSNNNNNNISGTKQQVNGGHANQAHRSNLSNGSRKRNMLEPEAPAPRPPQIAKLELYNSDRPDEVFGHIDQMAISVAREDQQTFTDLVHHLTRHCLNDVEKVRAIFRWITVKNLNTMHFDSSVKPDTPLGILRGIKNGSESYHVLFKRLCSYAGLHCVVIKGYSKSAGYQPGVRFEGNRFRNSWNAVFVAGAWRFVQCNWGARHLVSVAVMQEKNGAKTSDQRASIKPTPGQQQPAAIQVNGGRAHRQSNQQGDLMSPNRGRRGLVMQSTSADSSHGRQLARYQANSTSSSPASSTSSSTSSAVSPASPTASSTPNSYQSSSGSPQLSPATPMKDANSTNNNNIEITNRQATSAPSSDSLRYEYDDHYFLTDPDEFIYEFYPLSSEWQLLRSRPITLTEFEQLPFVRSLFFKYGLYFPQQNIRSVLQTDTSGATTIKIGMPTHLIPSLIFHYNLKYFDSDKEDFDGISLKRFVMQSVEFGNSDSSGQSLLANIVSFRIHLPETGAYILDIFANSITPTQYTTGEPMKFKSVCKFKIVAKNLKSVMIPLPDCASGEFGPMKATRLFGIIPLSHESGLISVQNDDRFLEIQFRMTRPLLDFMATLHKNGYDERQLSKVVKIFIDGDIVSVKMRFFEDGQYGLDIYTRDQSPTSLASQVSSSHPPTSYDTGRASSEVTEPKKQLLTHCCKYLINVKSIHNA